MTTDRTSSLTLSLSILVSVAVGVVIGHVFTQTDAQSTAPTTVTISDARELIDAMHALRDEMSHPHEPRNDLVAPPLTSTRVDASQSATDPSTDVAKDLRDATAEFVQVVGELHEAVKRNGPEPLPPVFPNARPDPAAVDADAVRSVEELNRSYLFSTYQQVIDRLGVPSGTGRDKNGSILWWYSGKTEGMGLNFQFVDGRVFEVDGSH